MLFHFSPVPRGQGNRFTWKPSKAKAGFLGSSPIATASAQLALPQQPPAAEPRTAESPVRQARGMGMGRPGNPILPFPWLHQLSRESFTTTRLRMLCGPYRKEAPMECGEDPQRGVNAEGAMQSPM